MKLTRRLNASGTFLVLSLGAGALLLAATPPFQVPDEPAHFFRAYSTATGGPQYAATGGGTAVILPASLHETAAAFVHLPGQPVKRATLALVRSELSRPLDPDRQRPIPVPTRPDRLSFSAISYSPVGYAASAAGMFIPVRLEASPLTLLYAARLANLLASTLLIWWAIRLAPYFRWVFAATGLLPMSVYLRASASIDALVLAAALLLTAAALRLIEEQRLSLRSGAVIPLLTIALGLIKPNYMLLSLLTLAAPRERFSSTRQRALFVIAVLASIALGAAAALFWAFGGAAAGVATASSHAESRGSFFLQQAAGILLVIADDLRQRGFYYLGEMVGKFGWLDRFVPWSVRILWLGLMPMLALLDGPRKLAAGPRLRAIALLLTLVSIVAVGWVLTVGVPGSAPTIVGVQGRYFLPLVPLALLVLVNDSLSGHMPRWLPLGLIIAWLWSFAGALRTLLTFFWA